MKGKRTALMMAAQDGHLEVVKVLIEAGADVNLGTRVCCLVIGYISESILKSVAMSVGCPWLV